MARSKQQAQSLERGTVAEPRVRAARASATTSAVVPSDPACFEFDGVRYRWVEAPGAQRFDAAKRAALGALLARVLVPALERRGARPVERPAVGSADPAGGTLRWVSWQAPDERAPVWALYRAPGASSARPAAPANDTFTVLAWGDGPALAWVTDDALDREALRRALRAPPPWLAQGFASGDPTFCVRVERGARVRAAATVPSEPSREREPVAAPVAATQRTAPGATRGAAGGAVERAPAPVLALLREFRRTHGREPFSV